MNDHGEPSDWKNKNNYEKGEEVTRLARSLGIGRGRKHPTNLIPGLCGKCSSGVVTKRGSPDSQHSEITVYCTQMKRFVPHNIMECTDFWDVRDQSMEDMAAMARDIDIREGPPGEERGTSYL